MGHKIIDYLGDVPPVQGWTQPVVLRLDRLNDAKALQNLHKDGSIQRISDNISAAIDELFHIANPSMIDSTDTLERERYTAGFGDLDLYGSWVYYPWNGTLVHFPSADDLSKLRGSRNRNLISDIERQELKNGKTILILGLSVGSNAVDSLLMQGIGSKYILVDMDHLDPTNLNRIRASYDQLQVHKVDIVAKKISELDPYIEQVHYKDGLDEKNLNKILDKHRPDIIIEEMDSLRMKIMVRMRAKELGIPVLMATDDGDDILLDIERYDLDKGLPLLHGILPGEIIDRVLGSDKISRPEMGAIIGRYFVNLENVPLRMIESLLEVGKSLPSWPQLGGAAVLSGLYLAYAARRILLGQPLNPGRFLMGPEHQLNPEIQTPEYLEAKARLVKRMIPPA